MAQTWHQVRPGEVRNNCGGCHAHSQQPTPFEKTAAAKPDYKIWDLTAKPPMFTTKAHDRFGNKWDANDRTGVTFAKGVQDIEFHRDIKPILQRSCVACHSVKHDKPAGRLALDDDRPITKRGLVPWAENVQVAQGLPKAYARLVQYAWAFQARRSPLMWMVHGKRLDGFRNEDIPSSTGATTASAACTTSITPATSCLPPTPWRARRKAPTASLSRSRRFRTTTN
jgi:mono/diheme cytochrome c family protein